MIYFLPSRIIAQTVMRKNNLKIATNNEYETMQPKWSLIRLTDRIIDIIFVKSSCLVRSLVKREILIKYNYNTLISLGMAIDGGHISAHAWIEESNGRNFLKVL